MSHLNESTLREEWMGPTAPAGFLEPIPEDRSDAPSYSGEGEWMPRSNGLRRWWHVMSNPNGSSSPSLAASSTRGVEAGFAGSHSDSERELSERETAETSSHTRNVGGVIVRGRRLLPKTRFTGGANSPWEQIRANPGGSWSLLGLLIVLVAAAAIAVYFLVDGTGDVSEVEGAPNVTTLTPTNKATSAPTNKATSTPVLTTPPSTAPSPYISPASPTGTILPTTMEPTQVPRTSDEIAALDSVFSSVSGDSLLDPTTPQAKARSWFLYSDSARIQVDTDGEDRVIQRYVLSVLYFALNGVSRSGNAFLSSSHECEWDGIKCDESTQSIVYFLNLSNRNLEGRLPPELGHLSMLNEISMFNNSIVGSLPSEMVNLTTLDWIDFTNNGLTGTIPSAIWNLPRLRYLYLSENDMTGSITNMPEDPVAPLVHIWLQDNFLTGGLPQPLTQFTYLESFVVYSNYFNSTLPEIWDELNVSYLDLSLNSLSGTLPEGISTLSSLEFLYVNDNELVGSIVRDLGDLLELKELWLHSNHFTGSIPRRLGNLESLTMLLLHDNDVTGSIPSELCELFEYSNLSRLEADCDKTTSEIYVNCSCCTQCH